MQSQQNQFNRIEFQSIPNQYPSGENVYCYFVVPGSVQPEQGDFVGLVQVGLTNALDLVCKKSVNFQNICGTNDQKLGHVLFEAQVLPKIGQQQKQYQFVYVKSGGLVYGISKPFTFLPSTEFGGQYMPYGQRSYESGIQQWISRLKRTVGGVYGEEFATQQPHQIQYQQGLRLLQRGLEQVLFNELEGIRSIEQGLQQIQKYTSSIQILPQAFHQEISKIQESLQELERLSSNYRQQQSGLVVPNLPVSPEYKKPIQVILQGLHGLRASVPVSVSVLVQEPIALKTKLQEIFASMPVESTWGQQHLEEVAYTVCKLLKSQEKCEQIQRELEQERIMSHLKSLESVLLKQQRIEDDHKEYLMISRDDLTPKDIVCTGKFDAEKRIAMRLKLSQFLKDVSEQVNDLRLKEQLHTTEAGQRLRQLIEKFEVKSNIELPTLRDLVLETVSGQVLSQVGLRSYYAKLVGLLDEIEVNLRDLELSKPEESVNEIFVKQEEQKQGLIPVEKIVVDAGFDNARSQDVSSTIERLRRKFQELKSNDKPKEQVDEFVVKQEQQKQVLIPVEKVELDNYGQTRQDVYPAIEQLRRKAQELKKIKNSIDLRLTQVECEIKQLEREMEQGRALKSKPIASGIETPRLVSALYDDFDQILSQFRETNGLKRPDEYPSRRDIGLLDTVSGIELLKDLTPEEIFLNQLIGRNDHIGFNGIFRQ